MNCFIDQTMLKLKILRYWYSILVIYFSFHLKKKVRTLHKFSSISFTTRTENMAIRGKCTISKNMNRADFHIMPYQTRHSNLSLPED